MSEEISLKLCLLNCITDESEHEAESEASISKPDDDHPSHQIKRVDEQNFVSRYFPARGDSEEVW